jgi:hypothetical protein
MPVRDNIDALIENAIACFLEGAPAIRDLGKPDNKACRPPGSFAAFVCDQSLWLPSPPALLRTWATAHEQFKRIRPRTIVIDTTPCPPCSLLI